MPDVSVRTAWEVLLPAGTQLLAGEAGLDRSVTWPVVLRTHPPAFDPLRGGELAIVPLDRLPDVVAIPASVLPPALMADLLRGAMVPGAEVVPLEAMALLLWAIALLGLSVRTFRVSDEA